MPDVKFSNLYPYTDFHELNLDWVIKEVKFWSERVGKSIQKIELTGTAGLVDTYTITYSDGSTTTFDVTNGNGIASVAKTGTAGLVDTYTITFQDGSTNTFEVHNGTASIDPTLTQPDYAADAKATGDAIAAANSTAKYGYYMLSHPKKPLLAEMMADFAWCSMICPADLTGKNVVLTINGTAGDEEVTPLTISPNTLTFSSIGTGWVGGVISADGVNYTVCNFKYNSVTQKIDIYPALDSNITNGTLSTLMYDSGANYTGMHLTENGFKAYAQNLYAKNPKHCEVGKYIAKFAPDLSTTTVSPFTWYGGQIVPAAYRFSTVNMLQRWLERPSKRAYTYTFASSYTPHTTKSGAYWEQNLNGQSGYLEAYVFAIANQIKLPTDQELHIVVTIDGVEKLNQIVSDSICRRIVVDYENATTGRIEVYSNKWAPVNGGDYGIGFGRVTWWVNDLKYVDRKIFPLGAVIAQEFDSWGTYHNEALAAELQRLHNSATGVTVPYTNNSGTGQTSAWGMSWYYANVWDEHPAISIHDFVINDTNSVGSAAIPATVAGPDGTLYNNKLTSSEYADNMIRIANLATSNGIQPVFMRNCQHAGLSEYYKFTNALIDALSEAI